MPISRQAVPFAIDFKATGSWEVGFDYGQHGGFAKVDGKTGFGGNGAGAKGDEFEARHRVRLSLEAVASERLSGYVQFEIGDRVWGQAGAAEANKRDANVKVRYAYLDWMPPSVDLKVRMGLQYVTLPNFTTNDTVLNMEAAGVTASYQFNENVGVSFGWLRPRNDNYARGEYEYIDGNGKKKTAAYGDGQNASNFMDNVDIAYLTIPLTFDGFKITPWGMYSAIGPNAVSDVFDVDYNKEGTKAAGKKTGKINKVSYLSQLMAANGAMHKDGSKTGGAFKRLKSYADAWWAGFSADLTAFDPFHAALSFVYGSVDWHDETRLNRAGWQVDGLVEYKMDWAIPGIVAWYASGDDSNPANGSERLPSFGGETNTNAFSEFAWDGGPYRERDALIGNTMDGTWGVGLRVREISFLENLKHTLHVNYIQGTNDPTMAKKLSQQGVTATSKEIGMNGLYMTTQDKALELTLRNDYKMYDNLVVSLTGSYMALWLDTGSSVWGGYKNPGYYGNKKGIAGKTNDVRDAWNIALNFKYSF